MNENPITLPSFISDSMVIQRNRPIRFFGGAPAGKAVTVGFAGIERAVTSDGTWEAAFPALDAGGPHTLTVACGEGRIEVSDVLVGEVWVAAGQSNMELDLDWVLPWPGDALGERRPSNIREFKATPPPEFHHPREDIPKGRWRRADSAKIGSFSALAYRFAQELRDALSVPVGIYNLALGGSPAEAWVDRETLEAFPEFDVASSNARNDQWRARVAEEDLRRIGRWHGTLARTDPGLDADSGVTERPGWREEGWTTGSIPEGRGDGTVGEGPGTTWVRRHFHATPAQAREPARLRLGALIDGDRAWINGIEVGSTEYRYPPRRYAVPPGVIREGTNELLVRLASQEGPAGFVAGKRYDLSWETDPILPRIELTGPCEYKTGIRAEPLAERTAIEWLPTGCFNARVAPITPMAVRGIIWYQGESNTHNPATYADLFRALIARWRRAWGDPEMPFLYVQLANYRDPAFMNRANGWAAIREAQRECRSIPGVGMATAADIGEWNDLHPTNKGELARRLALLARKIAYGDDAVEAEGPHPVAVTRSEEGVLRIELARATGFPAMRVQGFEIGDGEGEWRPATGVSAGDAGDGTAIIELDARYRQGDRMVRFAWADDPVVSFPKNDAGLPLVPFLEKIGFTEKY